MSPSLDRNPLLGEDLLCLTQLELEEKETSAPIYGKLEEVRLERELPLPPSRSVSHVQHPNRTLSVVQG